MIFRWRLTNNQSLYFLGLTGKKYLHLHIEFDIYNTQSIPDIDINKKIIYRMEN